MVNIEVGGEGATTRALRDDGHHRVKELHEGYGACGLPIVRDRSPTAAERTEVGGGSRPHLGVHHHLAELGRDIGDAITDIASLAGDRQPTRGAGIGPDRGGEGQPSLVDGILESLLQLGRPELA